MEQENPYIISGQAPQLLPSVLLYMDILGYKDLAVKAAKSDSPNEFLSRLHCVLTEAHQDLKDQSFFVLKAFTDNIVLAKPLLRGYEDCEGEFGSAFWTAALFQMRLAEQGFFVRGAISVGDAYVDDIAVFGEALIEAYEAESHLARDPRVILTASALELAKQHITYYDKPERSPQYKDLCQDPDGQWFVNYLYGTVLIAEDEMGPYFESLLRHKAAIEKSLAEFAPQPSIWSKYAWAANYHNYFCNCYPRYFDAEHRISEDKIRLQPAPIISTVTPSA